MIIFQLYVTYVNAGRRQGLIKQTGKHLTLLGYFLNLIGISCALEVDLDAPRDSIS